MKNLNELAPLGHIPGLVTITSTSNENVTTIIDETVTSSGHRVTTKSSNVITQNKEFSFSKSMMYQTMPARHSCARTRDDSEKDQLDVNLNVTHHHTLPLKKTPGDKFELPLPFGFHLDLDFLRCCSEDLVSGENLEKLQELKKQRRQQRKELEALMGVRQKQREDKMKEQIAKRGHSPKRPQPPTTLGLSESKHGPQHEFIAEALREVVSDFENYLDTAKEKQEKPMYRSAARAQRFRQQQLTVTSPTSQSVSSPDEPMPRNNFSRYFLQHQSSTSSLCSSISTTSTTCLNNVPSTDTVLAQLPSSVPMRSIGDCMETDSNISLNSEMSTNTLRNIREHIAKSLTKLKEYEKQVEAIPILQVKLSVLKEEKRLLLLKLKQRELQMRKNLEDTELETESEVEEELENATRPVKRSRSESPSEKMIPVVRKRSASACDWNVERNESPVRVRSELNIYTRDFTHNLGKLKVESSVNGNKITKNGNSVEVKIMTNTKCTAVNTDPLPSPPRKFSTGSNTVPIETHSKTTETAIPMHSIVTREELDVEVQRAIYKTEEEILGCPLLQRAMIKVEQEALNGFESPEKEVKPKTSEAACQVGHDNLAPFVISVGLQCKLEEPLKKFICEQCKADNEKGAKTKCTVGVGECKVFEDPVLPKNFREIGVCTERWVEVIKASKQTDTDDFAYKDTESPRVADIVVSTPEKVPLRRSSSLRKSTTASPGSSRRSSSANTTTTTKTSVGSQTEEHETSTQSTMTLEKLRPVVPTKDAKVGSVSAETKSIGVTAMSLPLDNVTSDLPVTPLATPEVEKSPVHLNLCDKCNSDIKEVASGIISAPVQKLHAPPSPDLPWVSKIPRPVPETPEVSRLKSATSTGNLFVESHQKSQLAFQRSKSNLTPTMGRRLVSPKPASTSGTLSPALSYRDIGTPPLHPSVTNTLSNAARRVQSPLAKEKKSLIPKLSPKFERKSAAGSEKSSQVSSVAPSPVNDHKSLIPRVVTPPVLRKMYPKPSEGGDKLAMPDRNVVRKNTYTKLLTGVNNPDLDKTATKQTEKEFQDVDERKSTTPTKFMSKGGFPLPGAALFTPIDDNRQKAGPSREMRAALKVLNDSLASKLGRTSSQLTSAINIIQQEWFKISSTKQSNPLDVEDYLEAIEEFSKPLLDRVVNLTDVNGNTALHYSVSHGNFNVVSVLLDSKVANPNILNKAGYTCVMLTSLAPVLTETDQAIVRRLFSVGNVNIRATQHGQTAIMLAASHAKLDMVQLLVEAGADVNIRDEDGSTALMCSAEHGHSSIVKYLLQHPQIDVLAKDNDGLTALAVAMEAGHRDIGVLIYANTMVSRDSSPYTTSTVKRASSTSHSRTASPARNPSSSKSSIPVAKTPTPPIRNRTLSTNR